MLLDCCVAIGYNIRVKVKDRNQPPVVVVALPFAYQDGMDKYNGIMRYLRESNVDWELLIVRDALNVELFRQYMSRTVSGVICGSLGSSGIGRHDAYIPTVCLSICQRMKIPLVGLDWPLEEFRWQQVKRCSFLNIDSETIGQIAARAFLQAGTYVSYGFVSAYPECVWSRDRGAFFAKELRRNRHCHVHMFMEDIHSGSARLAEWLRALPKPAAVFAVNDCTADIVLKTCARNGLRVPEDLSVVGVDDDPVFCVHTRPTLTSVHPDFEEMGYLAAKELAGLLSGNSKGHRLVVGGNPTVTNRMTTAPCSPAGMMVRRIDEIIEQRSCNGIDSNVIADELKISRRLLDLRYRQFRGMSVREAIIGMRIKRAKHLLAYSGHSIGTICKMCGYRTESYLGKVFHRQEGLSMGDYRMQKSKEEKV